MREPSIHITKLQFEEILNTLEVDNFPVEAFFVIARKMAINHRAVLVSNNKNTKRVTNLLLASKGDAALVADIIYATRIKLKHRGVRKINEGNQKDWVACKKLADICNTFCNDFGLDTREGFIKYIELGISRMTDVRNLIQRLIGMQENITEAYQSQKELSELNRSQLNMVISIKDYYYRKIADATGIYDNVDKPEKLIHFLRLKEFLDEHKWDYNTFIDAQFESLAWCSGLPDITQLYTDKAIERYNKFLYRMKGKLIQQTEPEVEGSLWDKIHK